jgi:hypothetical protein
MSFLSDCDNLFIIQFTHADIGIIAGRLEELRTFVAVADWRASPRLRTTYGIADCGEPGGGGSPFTFGRRHILPLVNRPSSRRARFADADRPGSAANFRRSCNGTRA